LGHFKLRILYSLLFVLGITGKVIGQDARSVQRVKLIEPFIKAENVQIQQDSEKNLWITTPVKILRYSSAEVHDYNKFRGVPKEIGSEFIATYTDSENKIWLAGNQGIAVFIPEQDSFEFISNTTGRIYAMREDAGKQLWIAAENGVFKLNINSDKKDFGLSRFLSENTIAADIAIIGNQIVFAGPNGILTINRKSGKFDKIDMGYYQNLQITSLLSVDDFIVLGTQENGLYKTDIEFKNIQRVYTLPYAVANKEITSLENFEDEIIVSTNGAGLVRLNKELELLEGPDSKYPENVYASYLDKQNLLWIVAKEGLFLQNFAGFAVERLMHNPEKYSSLGDDFVTATEKDTQGNVWFGTGKGLSIWNPGNNSWRHIENLNFTRQLKMPDHITDMAAHAEHMWVATANDGVYKINIYTLLRAHYSVDALFKTQIQSAKTLFIDSQENVWIGGEDGYLTQIKSNSDIRNYPIKDVQQISELGPKKIIVATRSKVYSLNPASGRITDINKLNASKGLSYYGINDFKITNTGLGIVATEGAGVLLYDFDNEKLEILNEENGLPSANITGIEWLSNDEFWIATDNGLAYYNKNEGSVKVFSELNGLTTNELTTHFERLKDGTLILGSTKGINIFKPKTLLAQNEFKPDLRFENFVLPSKDNKKSKIALAGKDEIKVNQDAGFQITFKGRSNLNPEAIRYSWKLEGLEEEWSKESTFNSVSYSGLAPGTYTFKVRSKLGNTGWTTPESFNIEVEPVGGTISTVYLFMGIGVISMVFIFAFVFIRKSRNADLLAKAELRNQLQKEFKKPVESAVHSLSQISASAEAGNNEDLQRYAARFDELFNQILNFNYEESAYEISKIDLHRHLPEFMSDFEPVFEEKSLEMMINDQWGQSEFFYNREILDKIFFSLVSGSACYSFKGGKIIINIIETNVGDLKLQITDNGRGIPDGEIKVLEKKKSISNDRKYRKSGLHYVLQAKELILKSGGSFTYETEKNEGSTFTAVLKNRKGDYRKVPERAAAIFKNEKAKGKPKTEFPKELNNLSESKILVIEDNVEIRDMLLKNIGRYCQVYQAATAEEGMEKAGMIFPDIIISATVLPDMNAFQLTKMLKRNIGLNHINIFMVADDDLVIGKEQLAGLTEVIRKPIDMNLLLTKVSKILKWQQELRNSYVNSFKENKEVSYRSESDEKFIANLVDIIIQNIKNENFSVHDLSAKIGVSSNTLFMKLKSLVNLSPQDFMEFTRLNYARDLMERGDLNVMEVAYNSGFSSPKLFYSSFKKFYGHMPGSSVEKPT